MDQRDWQTRFERCNTRLSYLLSNKILTDCTFLVGNNAPETITAHKIVLAMSSPVFEAMFYGSMPEGSGPITITDVQPEAFKLLLEFIYADFAIIPNYQTATELYSAARKYMIPFIQRNCSYHMLRSLTPQNACHAYEFANLFEDQDVLLAALKTIKRKTKEVLKEDTFYNASIETVSTVFSQPELDIDSEVDLFEAAEKYAESLGLKALKRNYEAAFQIERNMSKKLKIEENDGTIMEHDTTLEQPKDDEEVSNEEILKNMRKAISHIRFLTLSAQELASVASSTLLTQEEALTLMLIISGVEVPLPEGFCDNKVRRGLRRLSPYYSPTSPNCSPTTPDKATNSQQRNEIPQEATYECICEFSVPNFRTRKRAVHYTFATENYDWKLQVKPDTDHRFPIAGQKSLSVLVKCLGPRSGSGDTWRCVANVTLEIVGGRCGNSSNRRSFTHTYTKESQVSGFHHWLPWTVVCEGCLYSNTFKIIARVAATVPISKATT